MKVVQAVFFFVIQLCSEAVGNEFNIEVNGAVKHVEKQLLCLKNKPITIHLIRDCDRDENEGRLHGRDHGGHHHGGPPRRNKRCGDHKDCSQRPWDRRNNNDWRPIIPHDQDTPSGESNESGEHVPPMNSATSRCHKMYEDMANINTSIEALPCNRKIGKQEHVLHVPGNEVTSEVSTMWKCVINDYYYTLDLDFILKVKGGKKVSVAIDSQVHDFTETDLSVTEYDGYYTYWYDDSTIVSLKCYHYYQEGSMRLQYYDASGKLIINNIQTSMLEFEQCMGSENNGSYVDCTYLKTHFKEYPQEFIYRTIFRVKDKPKIADVFTKLSVNGVSTTQMMLEKDCGSQVYVYKYRKGQTLRFTCETDRPLKDGITIVYTEKAGYAARNESTDNMGASVVLDTKDLDKGQLLCKSGQLKSDSIRFQLDTNPAPDEMKDNSQSNGGRVAMIVVGVIVAIIAVISALCAAYWYMRIRNNSPTQNDNFNQFNNPISRRAGELTITDDDYEYTYIENEYNYISNDGLTRENSLYRRNQSGATPQIRIPIYGNQANKNCGELDVKFIATGKTDTKSTTRPTNTENPFKGPLTDSKNYINVKSENNKAQERKDSVIYNNLLQKKNYCNVMLVENNLQRDSKGSVKDINMRYSNLRRGSNVLQLDNDLYDK